MTRVLVWKELREQWAVLVALLVLGSGVLVAVATLVDSGEGGKATELRTLLGAGRLGLIMLLMTAGVVVGATLFAGEKEAGTFPFLDRLPAARWRVWAGKSVAGVGLVGVAVAVLLGVAVGAGVVGSGNVLVGWVLFALVVGYAAYGWGMLGSVLARTSLTACGIGLGLGTVAGVVLYAAFGIAMAILRKETEAGGPRDYGAEMRGWEFVSMGTVWGLLALPVPIAGWLYTAPDRARRLADLDVRLPGVWGAVARGVSVVSPGRWAAGIRRMLWLTVRQYRVPALILAGMAVVAGGTMTVEDVPPVVVWPSFGLGIGLLVGVVGMSDEQMSGAYRFWGERRLPAGRLWVAKLAGGFAVVLLLLIVALVPMVVGLAARGGARGPLALSVFRTGLFEGFTPGLFLTYVFLWPVYGLAFGHLAAVLFRKATVAGAVGLLTGGTLAALWVPSLLSGGLHGWQVFAPPLVALLTARLMVWPWATDRVGTRRPLLRLAAGAVGVLAVTATGIGYRVAEVPAVAEVEDDKAFAQTLPTYDEKQAGRDLRRAAGLYSDLPASLRQRRVEEPADLGPGENPFREDKTFSFQVQKALRTGWPADRPDLDGWLDEVFANGWDKPVFEAAKKPTGVLEDPNELTMATPLRHLDGVRGMGDLLLARGLQQQAHGKPEAFVDDLDAWLAAVRTTRNKSIAIAVLVSLGGERPTYDAVDRWLERLDGRPDLLRRALAVLAAHDAADPFDPTAVRLAEQTVVRNSIAAPSAWLPRLLDELRPGGPGERKFLSDASPAAELEANLVGFAWTVPWEQERLRRAVGLGNVPGHEAERREYLRGLPGGVFMAFNEVRTEANLTESHLAVTTARRASILKVALRLAQAETGRLPASLAELTPRYLPALPADPYSKGPFRYRVSGGEAIEREKPQSAAGLPPDGPPGVTPVQITVAEFHAVAGLAGGLVCWPLEPGWPDTQLDPPFDPNLLPGSVSPPVPVAQRFTANGLPFNFEEVTVPAGQGILWSVGPDRVDHGGVRGVEGRRNGGDLFDGDLIYLVPLPPEAKK